MIVLTTILPKMKIVRAVLKHAGFLRLILPKLGNTGDVRTLLTYVLIASYLTPRGLMTSQSHLARIGRVQRHIPRVLGSGTRAPRRKVMSLGDVAAVAAYPYS